jgi:carbonic anhydrase
MLSRPTRTELGTRLPNKKKMTRFLFPCLLCAPLALVVPVSLRSQEVRPAPNAAWQRLKEGNARFAADHRAAKDLGTKRRAELAQGQRPFAVILSCADSRVVPELLFDQGLGDLFVVRVAGNIAGPSELGSIAFAVGSLHVPLVVVLGHDKCGAVQAAVEGKAFPGRLGWLVKQVYTGNKLPAEKGAALGAAIRANALHQADVLRQCPELKDFVASKRTQIVVGEYSLATGKVTWLEPPSAKHP